MGVTVTPCDKAGAVVTMGVGVTVGGCEDGVAPPNTKILPKIMLSATIPPRIKFIILAVDHFFERPFFAAARDLLAIRSSSRAAPILQLLTDEHKESVRAWP